MPEEKKKLPMWLKVGIGVIAFFVIGGFAVGMGLTMLTGVFQGSGDKIVEKGLEKWIESKAKDKGIDVDVDLNLGKESFVIKDDKTGEKVTFRTDTKLPSGFPKSIPLPDGKIISSITAGGANIVTMESDESLGELTSFFKSRLGSQGWDSLMQMTPDDKTYSGVYRKGKQHLSVGVHARGPKRTVSLNYMKKK